MMKISRLFFLFLFMLIRSSISIAEIDIQNGVFLLNCGERLVNIDYRISADTTGLAHNKSALLLNGSPGTEFFGDGGGNYQMLQEALIWSGYKVIEISYALRVEESSEESSDVTAEGFYSACLHQGMDNVNKHSADLYDVVINKLGYDPNNPAHRLVGFGYSLGAVQIQSMAFTHGKKFNDIVLTGVLVGDVVNGCLLGLKYLEYLEMAHGEDDLCSDPQFSEGLSWASFIDLAQQITVSGNGCCDRCSDDTKNEYTEKFNFEKQPFFNASNLFIFEGALACKKGIDDEFLAANPAQAKYITDKREAVGAPTKTYYFDKCSHEIVNCAGNEGVELMLHALAPELVR